MYSKKIVLRFAYLCQFFLWYYKVFPFGELRTIKAILVPEKNINTLLASDPRYISYIPLFDGLSYDYDMVFLGDSITDSGRWSEAFIDKKVANRGIAGQGKIMNMPMFKGFVAM